MTRLTVTLALVFVVAPLTAQPRAQLAQWKADGGPARLRDELARYRIVYPAVRDALARLADELATTPPVNARLAAALRTERGRHRFCVDHVFAHVEPTAAHTVLAALCTPVGHRFAIPGERRGAAERWLAALEATVERAPRPWRLRHRDVIRRSLDARCRRNRLTAARIVRRDALHVRLATALSSRRFAVTSRPTVSGAPLVERWVVANTHRPPHRLRRVHPDHAHAVDAWLRAPMHADAAAAATSIEGRLLAARAISVSGSRAFGGPPPPPSHRRHRSEPQGCDRRRR